MASSLKLLVAFGGGVVVHFVGLRGLAGALPVFLISP